MFLTKAIYLMLKHGKQVVFFQISGKLTSSEPISYTLTIGVLEDEDTSSIFMYQFAGPY